MDKITFQTGIRVLHIQVRSEQRLHEKKKINLKLPNFFFPWKT